MIEMIGGIIVMVAVLAPIMAFTLSGLCCGLDWIWEIIDDASDSKYFQRFGEKFIDLIFSENPSDARMIFQLVPALVYIGTAIIYDIVLLIDNGKDIPGELLLWPYLIGDYISPALLPIAAVLGGVYTARTLRRLQKAAVKLKDTLKGHMNDKEAHKATQEETE